MHASTQAPPEADRTRPYRLAHISDPHLSTLEGVSGRDLCNQRILGYLSWRLHRRHEHRSEILGALLEDLATQGADHVVVTGDLTHLGLPDEFRQVADWLPGLGTPDRVTVVPGNHEAYVRTPAAATLDLWQPYMASDPNRGHATPAEGFPSLRRRGPIALIGLSSAHVSLPFHATGSVGEPQLRALAELLRRTGAEGLFRVLLIHHPPLPGVMRRRKRLVDLDHLNAVLEREGVELVLHGHAHRSLLGHLRTGRGKAPVVGVSSASARGGKPGRHARYHLYHLDPRGTDPGRVRMEVRGYDPARERFRAEEARTLIVPIAPPAASKP